MLLAAYQQAQVHYERWDTVVEARERPDVLRELGFKPTWDGAYEAAAKVLAKTPARGSPLQMRKSYLKVKRDMKRGAIGQYLISRAICDRD